MTGRVRLQKAPGASGGGQPTVPTTGGTPRVPKSACITACHNRAPTGRVWELGRPSTPRPCRPRGGGAPPLLRSGRWQRKVASGQAFRAPAQRLTVRWAEASGRQSRATSFPTGLEAPPCLALAGKPDSGEDTPNPGLLAGATGGKPGYRATPRGPRTPELPTSPAPCHPCSGPQQRQTLGSWGMKRETGKRSDRREGVTVQKKPVQPERALHAPERRAPRPRRLRPCPGRGNTEAGTSLDGGALSQSTSWRPA